MVLTLCEGLNIPLRDRNALLTSAGFAPQYKESPSGGARTGDGRPGAFA